MTSTLERDKKIEVMMAEGWTPELFAEFWNEPDPKYLRDFVTDDIVGHWAGGRIVRGHVDYIQALIDLMKALPGMRLETLAGARNMDNGFAHWKMIASGKNGPFEIYGADCLYLEGTRVRENFINFDTAEFDRLSGLTL